MHTPSRRGFTLIELLVVIAVIAILSVVVILALNPAQLLAQGRDANRLNDMATITRAVNLYSSDNGGATGYSLGTPNIVYLSIPDPSATTTAGTNCAGLGFSGAYHCAASSTFRKTNGTGWIPINFASTTVGSPLSSLPVDPINTTTSGKYYEYMTDGKIFEVAAAPESQKYYNSSSTSFAAGSAGNLINLGVTYTTSTLSLSGDLTKYCGFAQYVFDSNTNNMWASNYYCDSTTPGLYKINDSTRATTPIAVSAYAQYDINMAFDFHTKTIWLVDSNAKTATVVSDTTFTTTTVSVGAYPVGIAFDSNTNNMWVTNNTTSTVTIINDTTFATTSKYVKDGPYAIAFDSNTNTVWVGSNGGVVTIFNDTALTTTTITLAGDSYGPSDMVFDPNTNTMWFVGDDAKTVTAVNDTTFTARTVATGYNNIYGMAFDPHTNSIWAGTSSSTIIQINDRTYAITPYVGTDNTYDPIAVDTNTNTIWGNGNTTYGSLLLPSR